MASLTLISITCNRINPLVINGNLVLGGPIELRAPITLGPAKLIWGPQQMQQDGTAPFNTLLANNQPNPIDFFNPIWIELWEAGSFRAQTGQIAPQNSNSNFILSYPGGDYVLNVLVQAPELIAAA